MNEQPFGAGKEPGEQGSVDWLMSRCGKVTASRFKDVLDTLKSGKPGAKRQNYLWEVVIERLTGSPAQHYESVAMQHGTENEPYARMAYEAKTGNLVAETGFLHYVGLDCIGGSPDGLVGDDGGIECKCPYNSANHLATILDGMPEEHMAQVQGLMMVTGRKWWDFVSFDPRMPPDLQLYVQRIERDEAYIDRLEAQLIVFNAEAETLIDRLRQKGTA